MQRNSNMRSIIMSIMSNEQEQVERPRLHPTSSLSDDAQKRLNLLRSAQAYAV